MLARWTGLVRAGGLLFVTQLRGGQSANCGEGEKDLDEETHFWCDGGKEGRNEEFLRREGVRYLLVLTVHGGITLGGWVF